MPSSSPANAFVLALRMQQGGESSALAMLLQRAASFRGCMLLVGAVLCSAARGRPGVAQPMMTCRLLDDSTGTMLVQAITHMASGSDANSRRTRQRLGVPQLAAGDIALVTDEQTCRKAVTARNATQGVSTTGRRVYLVKVGRTRFAVLDPADDPTTATSTWKMVWFYDTKWVFISTHGV